MDTKRDNNQRLKKANKHAHYAPPESPLLRIPREIRDIIYSYTLLADHKLELAPTQWFDWEETSSRHDTRVPRLSSEHARQYRNAWQRNQIIANESLRIEYERATHAYSFTVRPWERLFKKKKNERRRFNLHRRGSLSNARVCIRFQDDLIYIRTKLGVTLLSTCRQIYHEASALFWANNEFSLIGPGAWIILLRFCYTLSPKTFSLMNIEVCVPGTWNLNIRACQMMNYPRLHLAKVSKTKDDKTAFRQYIMNLSAIYKARRFTLVAPDLRKQGDQFQLNGIWVFVCESIVPLRASEVLRNMHLVIDPYWNILSLPPELLSGTFKSVHTWRKSGEPLRLDSYPTNTSPQYDAEESAVQIHALVPQSGPLNSTEAALEQPPLRTQAYVTCLCCDLECRIKHVDPRWPSFEWAKQPKPPPRSKKPPSTHCRDTGHRGFVDIRPATGPSSSHPSEHVSLEPPRPGLCTHTTIYVSGLRPALDVRGRATGFYAPKGGRVQGRLPQMRYESSMWRADTWRCIHCGKMFCYYEV